MQKRAAGEKNEKKTIKKQNNGQKKRTKKITVQIKNSLKIKFIKNKSFKNFLQT